LPDPAFLSSSCRNVVHEYVLQACTLSCVLDTHHPTLTLARSGQTTGTARPCFICYKPSTICLATQNTVDFLYTCDAHLRDPGFATRVPDESEPTKPGLSAADIAEVKAEWEERQKRQKEKEKEAQDGQDGDKKQDKAQDKKDTPSKEKVKSPATTPAATEPPKPKHERYTLHRDIFSLRQAEHRKRRQTAEAKQLAPQLPAAPRSYLS
jgi:hypothetical protein